ncbi:hypothetical protein [Exiguobacterium profundum]
MSKFSALKVLSVGAVISSLVLSPYSIKTNFTSAEESVVEKPLKKISFVTSNGKSEDMIEKIKVKKDETLVGLKKNIDRKAITVESLDYKTKSKKEITYLDDSTDIAVNIKDVKNDKQLQQYLQQSIQYGKKVFIYGGLTSKEYKKILKLDELKVKDKNGKGSFNFGETHVANDEKGALSEDVINSNEETSVIGYTLDENEDVQYFEINITSYDENGQLRENDEEVYIQEILSHESEMADAIKSEELSDVKVSFLQKNSAAAANIEVMDKYGFVTSVYDSRNYLIGRLDTDFRLLKESKDTSSTYDYFTLQPITQINHYNGALSKRLYQNIAMRYDADELKNWTPKGDTSGSDFSLGMSFPFSISFSMSFKDAASIDDQSSLAYDYARWVVTDGSLGGETFEGAAGWASIGTYSSSILTTEGTFYIGSSNQYPVKGSKVINVDYNY